MMRTDSRSGKGARGYKPVRYEQIKKKIEMP